MSSEEIIREIVEKENKNPFGRIFQIVEKEDEFCISIEIKTTEFNGFICKEYTKGRNLSPEEFKSKCYDQMLSCMLRRLLPSN